MRINLGVQTAIMLVCFLATNTVAISSEQCLPISNFPGQITEVSWIKNATLQYLEIHKKLKLSTGFKAHNLLSPQSTELSSVGHKVISASNSDVLVFKQIFPGWPKLTDTANMAYITVVIPKNISGTGSIIIDGKDGALVFMSVGSPSFLNFCYGYAINGKIDFSTKSDLDSQMDRAFIDSILSTIGEDGALIRMSFQAALISSKGHKDDCGSCVFEGDFLAKKRVFSEVGPEAEPA